MRRRRRLKSFPVGTDRDTENSALLTYVRSISNVTSAALKDGVITVTLTDDTDFLIVNNRVPDPAFRSATPSSPSRAVGDELPGSKKALLFGTVGAGYDNAISQVRSMLSKKGYTVQNPDASLANLRNLGGASIRLLQYARWGVRAFEGSCNELLSLDVDASAAEGQRHGRADEELVQCQVALYRAGDLRVSGLSGQQDREALGDYAAVHQRVLDGTHANSIVFIDACVGDRPEMVDALSGKAAVFFLWDFLFNSCDPARYFFDRVAGTNAQAPLESPPQRPFDISLVWSDMQDRGLNAVRGSTLNMHQGTRGKLGLLAPTIEAMWVNELIGNLLIRGDFGTDTTDVKVTVGGASVPVVESSNNAVTAAIPTSGSGSAGDVIVTVKGHPSNARRLTEWRGTFVYTLDDLGSLEQKMNISYHLRRPRLISRSAAQGPKGGLFRLSQ